jgi:hypothetical protein
LLLGLITSADRDVRALEARQYQSELSAIRADQNLAAANASLTDGERSAQLARLQGQEAHLRHLLDFARAAGEKLKLDAAESRISGQDVQTVRDQLIAYQPDFHTAKDWPALGTSYAQLGAVWGLMPPDFQSAIPMPAPPALALLDHGRPTDGHDHPVVEAAWSIANLRDPADIFSLVLAVLFDAIPLVSIFATAGRYRRFPDRLADLRRWMEATIWQAQMMPGILPWFFQTCSHILWVAPIRTDDPRIAALELTLNHLKQEMDQFLQGLPMTPCTFEGISVQLASLFSQATVIAFDSGERLKNLAMRMYGIFSDAIADSALDDAQRGMAREVVAGQAERFTSAVNDAFAGR